MRSFINILFTKLLYFHIGPALQTLTKYFLENVLNIKSENSGRIVVFPTPKSGPA